MTPEPATKAGDGAPALEWKTQGFRKVAGDPRAGGAYLVSRKSDGATYELHKSVLTGYGDDAKREQTLLGTYPSEKAAQAAAEKHAAEKKAGGGGPKA